MHWDIEGLACVLGHRGFGVNSMFIVFTYLATH